jgi:hypothetical protein
MDISHDMGWAEAFVLDGDSLLLHSLLGAPGTRVDVGQPLAVSGCSRGLTPACAADGACYYGRG